MRSLTNKYVERTLNFDDALFRYCVFQCLRCAEEMGQLPEKPSARELAIFEAGGGKWKVKRYRESLDYINVYQRHKTVDCRYQLFRFVKDYAEQYEKDYFAYFDGCKRGYAYGLGIIAVFENPKELSEFGLKRAPQSFAYVKE